MTPEELNAQLDQLNLRLEEWRRYGRDGDMSGALPEIDVKGMTDIDLIGWALTCRHYTSGEWRRHYAATIRELYRRLPE